MKAIIGEGNERYYRGELNDKEAEGQLKANSSIIRSHEGKLYFSSENGGSFSHQEINSTEEFNEAFSAKQASLLSSSNQQTAVQGKTSSAQLPDQFNFPEAELYFGEAAPSLVGVMSEREVEGKLATLSPGAAIFRFENGNFYLSAKLPDRKYFHKQLPLEENGYGNIKKICDDKKLKLLDPETVKSTPSILGKDANLLIWESTEKGSVIKQEIVGFLGHENIKFFHGSMSKKAARETLKDMPPGTALIRYEKGSLYVSSKNLKGIAHDQKVFNVPFRGFFKEKLYSKHNFVTADQIAATKTFKQEIQNSSYYHRNLNLEGAEAKLTQSTPGDALIWKDSKNGQYYLSAKQKDGKVECEPLLTIAGENPSLASVQQKGYTLLRVPPNKVLSAIRTKFTGIATLFQRKGAANERNAVEAVKAPEVSAQEREKIEELKSNFTSSKTATANIEERLLKSPPRARGQGGII